MIDANLFAPDAFADGPPHALFRRLRAEEPVSRQHEPDGREFWAVTRYADVVAVSKQPLLFSSHRMGAQLQDLPDYLVEGTRSTILGMDPPQHSKYRRLISSGFTPRLVQKLEAHIRKLTTQIIDRVAGSGACDFVHDIAAQLPLAVIAELLGVPEADRPRIYELSNRVAAGDDPDYSTSIEESSQAAMEIWAYANELALARKAEPRDDLVSVLMRSEVDGERLTETEFDAFFLTLAVAGNETTRNLIAGGMLALFAHPDELARLRADLGLLPTAIDEMLRYVTPVMAFRRTVTASTALGGERLREGDKVVIYYVSANRDERVFPDPDRFDVARTPNDHLAFGIGEHYCMGASLARLEARVMFEQLLTRLPQLEMTGPARRLRSYFFNGVKAMPVRC